MGLRERRARGWLLGVVVAVAAGVLPGTAAVAAPAQAAAPVPLTAAAGAASPAVVRAGLTQPVYSYAGAVRETVYVEIPFDRDADGQADRVAADIIRPREPAAAGRRVPVIMDASPYYRCCGRGNESEVKAYGPDGDPTAFPLFYDNYFVPRGYAVVLVDLPGTARSTGCLDVGGRVEVLSAKAVIDWLNGRAPASRADGAPVRASWASGAVGMIGKSWDGSIANGVAATGVAGLRTIVPIGAISSWYHYLRWNGLVRYEGDVFNLVGFDFDYPQQPGDPEDPCVPEAARLQALSGEDTGNYTAFWAERDYRRAVSRVRASVLLVHGLNERNVTTDQLAPWWEALGRQGVRRKLWLMQVGHIDPFDVRRAAWVRTLHRWFDSELYGVRNGITAEPPVTREAAPGVFVAERAWPAPAAAPVTLPLTAGPASGPDRLGGDLPPVSARRGFTDDPEQTEQQMVATPGVRSGHRLAFLSAPLTRDVRISGTPLITLRASVDRPTTPLTALLVDYGPARRVVLGDSDGIRTLASQSCWGQSTPADDACYRDTAEVIRRTDLAVVSRGLFDAKHRRSLRREDFLTPGVDHQLRWPLLPQDVVVRRGHQLAVVIAGSDPDVSLPEPSNSATVSVRLRGSSVMLPVVGGAPALGFEAVTRVPVVGAAPAPVIPQRRPA